MANNKVRNILVINHEEAVIEFFKRLDEKMNMNIDCRIGATDGIEAAKQGDYLMCIVDVDLPGTDGLEVFKAIHSARPLLPIYMMSHSLGDSRIGLALEAGAKGFLLKPPNMDSIASSVQVSEVVLFFKSLLASKLVELQGLSSGAKKRGVQKEYDKIKKATEEAVVVQKRKLKKTG